MAQIVALLRGINLGPNRRVSMAELRDLLTDLGYEDVRTLLQSGNVVLSTDRAPAGVARAVGEAISSRFGMSVDVVVRTGAELARVVKANPIGDRATDGSKYFVVFFPGAPDPAALRKITAEDVAPDEFVVRKREIYVWCPNGMRDSRLMRALTNARTAPAATVRNWNTVTKLLEMVRAGG